jgi:hypothetical protein
MLQPLWSSFLLPPLQNLLISHKEQVLKQSMVTQYLRLCLLIEKSGWQICNREIPSGA